MRDTVRTRKCVLQMSTISPFMRNLQPSDNGRLQLAVKATRFRWLVRQRPRPQAHPSGVYDSPYIVGNYASMVRKTSGGMRCGLDRSSACCSSASFIIDVIAIVVSPRLNFTERVTSCEGGDGDPGRLLPEARRFSQLLTALLIRLCMKLDYDPEFIPFVTTGWS
jgi:hypothetical protein